MKNAPTFLKNIVKFEKFQNIQKTSFERLFPNSTSSTDLSSKEKVKSIINDLNDAKSAVGPDYLPTSPPTQGADWPAFLVSEKSSVRNRKLSPEETAALIKGKYGAEIDKKHRIFYSNIQYGYNL